MFSQSSLTRSLEVAVDSAAKDLPALSQAIQQALTQLDAYAAANRQVLTASRDRALIDGAKRKLQLVQDEYLAKRLASNASWEVRISRLLAFEAVNDLLRDVQRTVSDLAFLVEV